MGFLELLDKNLIKVPLAAANKDGVFEELIDLLADNGKLLDRDQALQDVFARELLGSTGLERGIAIPHAKTAGVDSMVMAIGISPGGIDFEALDGGDSKIFFMILASPKQAASHIEVLSDIARATKSNAMCRLLVNAADSAEVLELFEEED